MIRKKIYIVVFVISVIGLFVVQYQYLIVGLNLARVQFEKKVNRAEETILRDLSTENRLTFLIAQSFQDEDYFLLGQDSLQNASRYFLNDFIGEKLEVQKINTDFSYVLSSRNDSLSLLSPLTFPKSAKIIKYPIKLEGYLPEKLATNLILELQFADLNYYFLSQLKGLLIPGLFFLGIIIFVVIWMLRLFFWQRNVIIITNDFINNLTHELKTPLFSIKVATRILENDGLEKQKPVLYQVRKQTERLNQHIEQVLELASLETRKTYIELEVKDLRPELLQWCEDFKLISKLEGFKFNFELETRSYKAKVSLFHLENTISNLLDNAKKYSENPIITLRAFVQKNKIVILIEDNGQGIPEKERKRVFRKFYRVPEGDLHKVEGYGLGLSYVKEVIKVHGGKIKLESQLNKGTQIQITIPLQNDKD